MEKIRYMRLPLLIYYIIFFIGCTRNNQVITPIINNANNTNINQKEINRRDINISNKNGILYIFDGKKEYILSSKGLEYKIYLSNDKKVLLVNVLKMNNLQTIILFSKKDSNRYKKIAKRLEKEIWNTYLKNKNYEFNDINNPQLIFYEWVDNNSFEIRLSYEFENKLNEEIIRYDIF